MSAPPPQKKQRNESTGLRPDDSALLALRSHSAVGPHTGALSQDQHRRTEVSGYSGQSTAHDTMRESFSAFSAQATPLKPLIPLEASMHMASAHLHATLPGIELEKGLTHGYSRFKEGGSLKKEEEKKKLSVNIDDRREQCKSNWWSLAEYLPIASRKRIAMPSPERETLERGGGYISSTSPRRSLFDSTNGSKALVSESDQRELGRSILRPMFEPSWQPAPRLQGKSPAPFHGDEIREVHDLFTQQDAHNGEVGSRATESYRKKEIPHKEDVRVDSVHSSVFFSTANREVGAGLHEVAPTDTSETISKLPDESRMAMAFGQADVRTNTALTFFRAVRKD